MKVEILQSCIQFQCSSERGCSVVSYFSIFTQVRNQFKVHKNVTNQSDALEQSVCSQRLRKKLRSICTNFAIYIALGNLPKAAHALVIRNSVSPSRAAEICSAVASFASNKVSTAVMDM